MGRCGLQGKAARLGLALCAALMLTGAAEAAATRFVSSIGSDANACSFTAPCRTLQRGVDVTPAGGELFIQTAGSFGSALAIGKSITIAADGAAATITAGVTINGANAVVLLRGLLLNGGNAAVRGVHIQNASAVFIQNCVIERFTGNGIEFDATAELYVSGSLVHGNGQDGLRVFAHGSATRVNVDDSHFDNNGDDGMTINGTRSTIVRTVTSGNGGNGIESDSSRINVTHSVAANNGASGYAALGATQLNLEYSDAAENTGSGVFVAEDAEARISNNAIGGNGIGVNNNGSTRTRENNSIVGNTTDVGGANPLVTFDGAWLMPSELNVDGLAVVGPACCLAQTRF